MDFKERSIGNCSESFYFPKAFAGCRKMGEQGRRERKTCQQRVMRGNKGNTHSYPLFQTIPELLSSLYSTPQLSCHHFLKEPPYTVLPQKLKLYSSCSSVARTSSSSFQGRTVSVLLQQQINELRITSF